MSSQGAIGQDCPALIGGWSIIMSKPVSWISGTDVVCAARENPNAWGGWA